ncbi:MAG: DNA repair protein RecN [Actinobacteria bacterium]|nr:DNA repair protein RecN [Actinomycetota bacterium]
MLLELRVADLGIVEEITVELGVGLTAITGETGAGKTLLVEALELLLGRRADPALVRDGAGEARVEGRFVGADDEEHVLARVLPADGRSRAYIDGRLATAGELGEIGATLVDLHGQHAHQHLLVPAEQRAALDQFAGTAATDALAALRAARAEARTLRTELDALGGDDRARAREADLLRFQIAEIDDAAIVDAGEDDALRAEEALLADAVAIRESLHTAYDQVERSGLDALGAAAAALGDRPTLAELHDRTKALQAEVAELAHDLRVVTDGVAEDPERLEGVRTRRQLLRQLRRKYGETLADVLTYATEVRDRLGQIEHHEEHAAALQSRIAAADGAAMAAARDLRAARAAAAGPLAAAVTRHLRELAMPRAEVSVTVEPGDLTDDGADVVTFLLAANAGESARPLAKAASGGELARTMLALRLVTADAPSTLVFDEVDAGIGGEAGTAVGRLLGVLGAKHQVLCVTHLAQVAAFADHQVVVEKGDRDGRTVARATPVEAEARVRELSRMLAGVGESDHARNHAAELLAAAHETARPVKAGRR